MIGNFDGVHRGHRAVLEAAARDAKGLGIEPVALTFDPHPSEVLGRGKLPVLTPPERKIELMLRLCPELTVVVEPFTLELAALDAEVFAERLLAGALGARVVMVGEDFRFGRGRRGDLALLREVGARLGFDARAERLFGDANGAFSSSRIREALKQGDLVEVTRGLGRPHALTGNVVQGAGRGRTIGAPTANLDGIVEALPPNGVYACLVDELSESGARALAPAAVNVGNRPTVSGGFSVEAHLLDFSAELYGKALRLHLVARLRDERKFESLDALKAQIRARLHRSASAAGRCPPDRGSSLVLIGTERARVGRRKLKLEGRLLRAWSSVGCRRSSGRRCSALTPRERP